MTRLIVLAALVSGCGGERITLRPPPDYHGLTSRRNPPALVVFPAVDQRPAQEREGSVPRLGCGVIALPVLSTLSHTGGATVSSDESFEWARNAFPGLEAGASTMFATDVGQLLSQVWKVKARYVAEPFGDLGGGEGRVSALRLAEGTIVVVPVLDLLGKSRPLTQYESLVIERKDRGGGYVERTDHESGELKFGARSFNTHARLQLFEVGKAGISRREVSYAGASEGTEWAYGTAVVEAARQIIVFADRTDPAPYRPPPAPAADADAEPVASAVGETR